ncbi:MAG TPA: hypothetical protein VHN80_25020, partial [Kineosporiaceae bacterium]|nr:hypothetical protein [Kineosporiaceae bacterium]
MTDENLADLRIRVEPGGGVVAVLGGVLLVIPTISAGQDDAVDALLAAAVTPGVVRAVARVVADFDEERIPPFSLVVEGGLGPMFALVHGEVVLHAIGSADEVRLAGREARSWVDRTLPGGVERLSVLPQDAEPGPGDAYSDLRAGVVRGGGVLVTRREPEVASQPEPSPEAASQPEPSPEAAPEPELQPQPEPQPDLPPEPRSDPAPEQVLDPEVSFGSGAAMPADAGAEAEEPVVAVELPVEQVEPPVEQVEEAEPSTRDEQAHLSDDVPADVGVPEQHQDVGVPEQHQT